jgi:hypothetical protein
MFKLPTGDQTFVTKIQFQLPTDNGGHAQHSFKAKFKRLPVTELKEWILRDDNVELMREVFIDFEGIEGTDGRPCEFNTQARDALLEDAIILNALVTTYLREMQGGGRRKN